MTPSDMATGVRLNTLAAQQDKHATGTLTGVIEGEAGIRKAICKKY
jgi:hypothetical protein